MSEQKVTAVGVVRRTGVRLCLFEETDLRDGARGFMACKESAGIKFGMFAVSLEAVEIQ